MDIESKLDEDFIFYLGFGNTLLKHVRDKETRKKCEVWLEKLCGEEYEGIDLKRGRNVYLSQLLLFMQSGSFQKVFSEYPVHINVLEAFEVFDFYPEEGELHYIPPWCENVDVADIGEPQDSKKNRTYLATRILPDGQGAFAYAAVTFGDEEFGWEDGAGEGALDSRLARVFEEEVPDYEMERILKKRKNPQERERVITFYKVLLQNIEDELDVKIQPGENRTINGLLEQLEDDLRDREAFTFDDLSEENKRIELLLMLHAQISLRVSKIIKRGELLDEAEKDLLSKSIFETSITSEDKFELPAQMWEQAINRPPARKHLEKLRDTYPMMLVEKFIQLLCDFKEEIAMRMHRRHESICAQMKRELRREDAKGKKLTQTSQDACNQAQDIYALVKSYYDQKLEAEKRIRDKSTVKLSKHSELYERMREALSHTQKSVEHEASRGKFLASQIGELTEQTEQCSKTTEENVRKIEETNMKIMKNIQRLNAAIENMNLRIKQVQNVGSKKGGQMMDIF